MTVTTFLWLESGAEEAAALYTAAIPNSRITSSTPGPDGRAFIVGLDLDGHAVTLMNGGPGHPLSDSASLQLTVDGQAEVDRLWAALTADGGTPGPCGWLTDRFGLSWQVVPAELPELMGSPDPARAGAVATALRTMSKIDVAALRAAHDQG
ncbi:VOC family protein [Nocardia sp. NPDC057227]|uniref:VOC family protein n=1 Tax=Nocardia sp. NPDC057227 TaxID=3346056 RepID=UPI003642F0BD